jgi:hypothetical protein
MPGTPSGTAPAGEEGRRRRARTPSALTGRHWVLVTVAATASGDGSRPGEEVVVVQVAGARW